MKKIAFFRTIVYKSMVLSFLCFWCASLMFTNAKAQSTRNEKLIILVLTDIENEPDDAESLVCFLLYSNQWDVEGIIATTSCHQKDKTEDWRIEEIVKAYGKVRQQLLLHEPGFPSKKYFLIQIKIGYSGDGKDFVGSGFDLVGYELYKPITQPFLS